MSDLSEALKGKVLLDGDNQPYMAVAVQHGFLLTEPDAIGQMRLVSLHDITEGATWLIFKDAPSAKAFADAEKAKEDKAAA